jgi:uncharacterized protein
MDRTAAIEVLQRHAQDIRSMGVGALYLFGSTERDEATTRSDIDLFIDYADPKFSLVELARLKEYLTRILQAEADVTTRGGLHPLLRDEIERTSQRVL